MTLPQKLFENRRKETGGTYPYPQYAGVEAAELQD